MSDEALIMQIREGDTDKFGEIYEKYVDKIFAFIVHKTFNKELAEDLTQDVFVKILNKISSFDPQKASLQTWCFTIARNTVIDHYRTFKSESDIDDFWDLSSDDDVLSTADKKLKLEKISHEMKRLSARDREILTLRFWQDLKFSEIAEICGMTESAAKVAASRAIKKLKMEFLFFIWLSSLL